MQAWAVSHDLWYGSGFTSYAKRVDGEPSKDAVIFILYSSGGDHPSAVEDLAPALRAQFDQVTDAHGFYYGNYDGYSYYFFATTAGMQASYDEYFHWKWLCSLIIEDFGDLYAKLYQYFHRRPERLHKHSPDGAGSRRFHDSSVGDSGDSGDNPRNTWSAAWRQQWRLSPLQASLLGLSRPSPREREGSAFPLA